MSADGVWRRRLPGRSAAPESVTLRERSVFGIEGPGFLREGSVFGGPFGRVSLISSWMPPSTGAPRPPVLAQEVGIRRGSRGPLLPLLAATAAPGKFPGIRTNTTRDPPFGSSAAVPRNGAGMVYFPRGGRGSSFGSGAHRRFFFAVYSIGNPTRRHHFSQENVPPWLRPRVFPDKISGTVPGFSPTKYRERFL